MLFELLINNLILINSFANNLDTVSPTYLIPSEKINFSKFTFLELLIDLIRLLNVDEKLKDYRPEFREKTELTPIKVLKIKSIDEIDLLDRMMGK